MSYAPALNRAAPPQQRRRLVDVDVVTAYLARTLDRGVPMRVALTRCERRYGVDRNLARAFLRSQRSERA